MADRLERVGHRERRLSDEHFSLTHRLFTLLLEGVVYYRMDSACGAVARCCSENLRLSEVPKIGPGSLILKSGSHDLAGLALG